jgi:hypothetical protein
VKVVEMYFLEEYLVDFEDASFVAEEEKNGKCP